MVPIFWGHPVLTPSKNWSVCTGIQKTVFTACSVLQDAQNSPGGWGPQTSLSLGQFELRHSPDPTPFDAFGDSHPPNLLAQEWAGVTGAERAMQSTATHATLKAPHP